MVAALQWAEVAKGVLAIAQVVAIVGGTLWAYFKFVRGRTFAERIEASVDANAFHRDGISSLRIRVSLTNTGASAVQLKPDVKKVRVCPAAIGDTIPSGLPLWDREHFVLSPVLEHHAWIEAQETIRDEVLVTVDDRDVLAFEVELLVGSEKRKRWSAKTIVPAVDLEETKGAGRCDARRWKSCGLRRSRRS